MAEVPKIVAERLRVASREQTHPHPDSDLLTAFAEQALPAAERDGVLKHLALCWECREVIALALPDAVAGAIPIPGDVSGDHETSLATLTRTPGLATRGVGFSWTRFSRMNLGWAALGAGVVVAAMWLVRPEHSRVTSPARPASGSQVASSKPVPSVAPNDFATVEKPGTVSPDMAKSYAPDSESKIAENKSTKNENKSTKDRTVDVPASASIRSAMPSRGTQISTAKSSQRITGAATPSEPDADASDDTELNQNELAQNKPPVTSDLPTDATAIIRAKPAPPDTDTAESIGAHKTTAIAVGTASLHSSEPLRPEWCHQLPRPEYAKLERVLPDEPWFEIYRIRPGVIAIYEPKQFEEVISYLILGEKRAVLFDTGMGIGRIGKTVARLTTLPVTVINSHTHFDHVGGDAEFLDIWNRDLPYTRHNMLGENNAYSHDALAPERVCGGLPAGANAGSYSIRPWRSTHTLYDGERVDLGRRELEVIFTPGHTPDSLVLFDRTNGLLFTGDSFYPGQIYLFVPETDFPAYTRSVARLSALEPQVKLLLPAHNVPVAQPFYLKRLNEAVRQVQEGSAKAKVTEGHREYSFDGFSLLLPNR
jgi:glyoxylase-like metal-dependent hydrolase (beta-lactamase superfamily II)